MPIPGIRSTRTGLFIDKTSSNSLYCEIVERSESWQKRHREFLCSWDRAEPNILNEAVSYDARVVWRTGNFLGLSLENGPRQVLPSVQVINRPCAKAPAQGLSSSTHLMATNPFHQTGRAEQRMVPTAQGGKVPVHGTRLNPAWSSFTLPKGR